MVGYKPSFKQNQKAVKEFTYENKEFVEDNEIHDETIKDPNSIKAGMIDGEMVEAMQKTIQTVTDMCQKYIGTGRIINMDNLYSSPEVFIALKKKGLYACGIVSRERIIPVCFKY